jgi:acyl-coenzyme A thioesterase PaaI-like protein
MSQAAQGAAGRGGVTDARERDSSQGVRLLSLWRRLESLPGGRWLFSKAVGRVAPYSGTIGARVESLEPGRAVLTLRDRKRVRNHLRSVHAIALANLGELSSGLAAVAAMPKGVRGIPVRITIDYHHKARGILTAIGVADFPPIDGPTRVQIRSEIRDEQGHDVATVNVEWALERVKS